MLNKPAREFKTKKVNRRKTRLLNWIIVLLLLFVLIGTTAPFIAKISITAVRVWDNVRSNLAFGKKVVLEPVAPSFKDQIKAALDPAVFEIKSFKDLDDYSVEASSSSGVTAIFSNQVDVSSQVSSLQTLLVKSRIEAKKIKKIDLRFNKTVVEYE